jgi:hypothetical protein
VQSPGPWQEKKPDPKARPVNREDEGTRESSIITLETNLVLLRGSIKAALLIILQDCHAQTA